MAITQQYSSLGAQTRPFSAADVDDSNLTFATADPGQGQLMGLFEAAINAELGTTTAGSWYKVCASLPSGHELYQSITPVANTLELEPTPDIMGTWKSGYPILSVHRTGEALIADHTIERIKRTQPWNVHWVLGPLDVGAQRKLCGALSFIGGVIGQCVKDKSHPAYESGALQFFSQVDTNTLAQPHTFGSVKVINSAQGQAAFAGEDAPRFFALTLTLQTVEYGDETLAAYPTFQAMDLAMSVGDGDELIPDLVLVTTDYPGDHWSDS